MLYIISIIITYVEGSIAFVLHHPALYYQRGKDLFPFKCYTVVCHAFFQTQQSDEPVSPMVPFLEQFTAKDTSMTNVSVSSYHA